MRTTPVPVLCGLVWAVLLAACTAGQAQPALEAPVQPPPSISGPPSPATQRPAVGTKVGDAVPPFTVQTLEGKMVTLEEVRAQERRMEIGSRAEVLAVLFAVALQFFALLAVFAPGVQRNDQSAAGYRSGSALSSTSPNRGPRFNVWRSRTIYVFLATTAGLIAFLVALLLIGEIAKAQWPSSSLSSIWYDAFLIAVVAVAALGILLVWPLLISQIPVRATIYTMLTKLQMLFTRFFERRFRKSIGIPTIVDEECNRYDVPPGPLMHFLENVANNRMPPSSGTASLYQQWQELAMANPRTRYWPWPNVWRKLVVVLIKTSFPNHSDSYEYNQIVSRLRDFIRSDSFVSKSIAATFNIDIALDARDQSHLTAYDAAWLLYIMALPMKSHRSQEFV